MANYDILFVEDEIEQRIAFKEQLKRRIDRRPDDVNIYTAANPAQAKQYFERNRELGQGLCIVSDKRMTIDDNYDCTDFLPPHFDSGDFEKDDISDLIEMASQWQQETDNDVFLVKRSADDSESSSFEDLFSMDRNNFDNPFVLKKTQSGTGHYIDQILKHCDELFAIEV